MSEWKTYKYTDIATIVGGGTPKTTEVAYWNGKIPWISIKDLVGTIKYVYSTEKYITELGLTKSSAKLLHEGDIVISARGTIGEIAILSCPMSFNQSCFGICANENIVDGTFLYYLTKTKINALKAVSYGSVFDTITSSTFENLEISLPPLPEQKRIAGILSALDDKIELNRRINANLEAQAMTLYKQWFVDFEPWNGVMPHDWREGCIADIVELLNGFAFKSSDFDENGIYRLITIKGVQDGKMSTEGADKLSTIPQKMPEWCLLQKGDVLLSLTGNVGRCCLVDENNCLLNQRVAKVLPRKSYNKLFSYIIFRQNEMKAKLISIARGTAQMNLSPIETGKQLILVPSEVVLKDFGGKYNHIIDSILLNIEESSCLISLRDTLLKKLMNGGIIV